jgi:metallophosphoesterase (TIGR00282 family)
VTRLLFVGDIVGKPGRELVRHGLASLADFHQIDLVIVNAENSAAGFGITREIGDQLLDWGVDVMTSGNHIWDKKEIIEYINKENLLLRPANYPPGTPGAGSIVVKAGPHKVAVLNLMGRVFLPQLDCPFRKADEELEKLRAETPFIIVDMHAEATSESQAMGWHLDGRVSAVVGTHRHVQTADERLLPKGTAYITDLGLTGPVDSVIGVEPELALGRFLSQMPNRFEPAKGPAMLQGAVIRIDPETGRGLSIERLRVPLAG